tara:strand:+ start:166 stop:450 length:285 start_codon:yes stop_codon:yes gene_type:complete
MAVSQHHRNTLNKLDLQEMLELNKYLVGLIKAKRSDEARRMKRQLFVGTRVSFEDNDGQTLTGRIVKVMRKYAQVDVAHCTWRVPLTALTKEAA